MLAYRGDGVVKDTSDGRPPGLLILRDLIRQPSSFESLCMRQPSLGIVSAAERSLLFLLCPPFHDLKSNLNPSVI